MFDAKRTLGARGLVVAKTVAMVLAAVFVVLDMHGRDRVWRIVKAFRAGASDEKLISYVLETARVFEDHNVTYWLDDGSLLGALRDGGPLISDYDADISILGDEREMQRAFLALKAGLPKHLRVEICYFVGHPREECHGEWIWDDLPPRVPEIYLNALNIEVCAADAKECHNPDLDIFPCSVSPDGQLVGSTSKLFRYPTLDECLNSPNTIAWHSINENHRWNPAHHQYLPAPGFTVLPFYRFTAAG
jgi:hypothetical protein